jgi:hypothetical protein
MPTRVDGIGTKYIGNKNLDASGEFTTTEWFTLFYFPLVPLKSYRVVYPGSPGVKNTWRIINQIPLDRSMVLYTYLVSILTIVVSLVVLAIVFLGYTLATVELSPVFLIIGCFLAFLPFFITPKYLLAARPKNVNKTVSPVPKQ